IGAPPASLTTAANSTTSGASNPIATSAASMPRAFFPGASFPRARLAVAFFFTALRCVLFAFRVAMVDKVLYRRLVPQAPRAKEQAGQRAGGPRRRNAPSIHRPPVRQ